MPARVLLEVVNEMPENGCPYYKCQPVCTARPTRQCPEKTVINALFCLNAGMYIIMMLAGITLLGYLL